MTVDHDRSADESDEPQSLEPTDAEIKAWTTRERHRRQQWLKGPTPEQAATSLFSERERRHVAPEHAQNTSGADFVAARAVRRSLRTAQLAAEGAISLLLQRSLRDVRDRLVRAGLDWEQEFDRPPTRGRRGALDTDPSDFEPH